VSPQSAESLQHELLFTKIIHKRREKGFTGGENEAS